MKNIKLKDKGPEVLDLQNQLVKLFYALSPDSDFGNNTLSAVQAFQTLHSIPVTGVVNDATYTAIVNDVFLNAAVDKPSMDKIAKLHPKIRHEILFLVKECFAKTGIKIRIAQGLRTFAEQAAIYAQGRTAPGKVVTKANAGLSNHNYGLACFSDDTEILTEDGFKLFKELTSFDKVATFKDGVGSFERPEGYISYPYNGEMVHIKSRSVDQLITPNHKCIVKKKTNTKWDKEWHSINAENLNHQYKIPTGFEKWLINEKVIIPTPHKFTVHAKSSYQDVDLLDEQQYPFSNIMDAETWWEFMGWYLAEGYFVGSDDNSLKTHSGRFKVAICQSDNSTVKYKLRNCLEKTGFNFKETSKEFSVHSKELWSVLHSLGNCYNKEIPRYLLEADNHLLKKLFDGLVDGDGSYYEKHITYYTASKKLLDNFSELCLRLGYSVSSRIRFVEKNAQIMPHGELNKSDSLTYEIITRNRKTQELRNGNSKPLIKKQQYNGNVYCVKTKAGAVVIRRNGKISISGNCDFVILKSDGTVSWDTYVDADHDGQRDWIEVINIFKAKGYKSGIDWNFVDAPHLEKMFGYSIRQLLDLHNAGKVDKEGYVLV